MVDLGSLYKAAAGIGQQRAEAAFITGRMHLYNVKALKRAPSTIILTKNHAFFHPPSESLENGQ